MTYFKFFHEGKWDFKSEECSKMFGTRNSLKAHIKTVFKIQDIKNVKNVQRSSVRVIIYKGMLRQFIDVWKISNVNTARNNMVLYTM